VKHESAKVSELSDYFGFYIVRHLNVS
jgi:hypothetical protein